MRLKYSSKKRSHYLLFLFSIFAFFAACKKETVMSSKASFSYEIVDQNYTVPVRVSISNTSTGAKNYQWTFEGGTPAISNKKDPGVIQFDGAGTYKIKLRAWNEDNESVEEISLQSDSAVTIDFDATAEMNSFSPVAIKITNKTIGGKTFNWVFEGGTPASSTLQHPTTVNFIDTGYHNISLTVANGRESFTKTKKIYVGANLTPAFTIVPSFQNNDFEAPLNATLKNASISGLTYSWSSTGGIIDNPTNQNPNIYFENPGTYTVTLTAANGKESKTTIQSITVLPNKNLQTFTDIKLGINTAHAEIGSFFSTRLRKTFKQSDDLDTAGKYIDVVYFGLNKNFTYNKFLSPDSTSAYTFNAIPHAMASKIINTQESCGCGTVMSTADFDQMTNGAVFQNYGINPGSAGKKQFTDAVLPRIILYQAADGRKGAIRIKQYVVNGAQSYILVDIKVQKTPQKL